MNPVVLVCPGPSLDAELVTDSGLPLCAISTGIRCVSKPQFWCFVDRVKPIHGKEAVEAMKDPDIVKIVPKNRRRYMERSSSVIYADRHPTNKPPIKPFVDGKILLGSRQSISFAAQWLALEGGFTELIFAGCDLSLTRQQPYAHKGPCNRRMIESQLKNFKKLQVELKNYAEAAAKIGVTFLSWTKESPINEFMESYDGRGSVS